MVDLIDALLAGLQNPLIFLPLVFVYSFLVAIVLPIPIEAVLIDPVARGDLGYFAVVAVVMAAGKTVGALAVFWIGVKVSTTIHYWSGKARWIAAFVRYATAFVDKTRYVGLVAILSVPLMTDTVPIYIYALFQERGDPLNMGLFAAANFVGGLVRATIIALVALYFQVFLV